MLFLSKWAKSERKGAAERALALIGEMPDCGISPGTFFCSFFLIFAVVLCWSKYILRLGSLDECSYNSVLHAISKESEPSWVDCAEEIFHQQMPHKSKITYHIMMNLHGKSSNTDGAKKAEGLLRGMKKQGLSPDDWTYNICIDAYARRGHVSKAQNLLEEMIFLSNQGKLECRPSIHSFASVVSSYLHHGASLPIYCSLHATLSHYS